MRTIIAIGGVGLRYDCHIKLCRAVRHPKPRETADQRKDDAFHTAHAWCKEMGVDQELHSGNFRVIPWPMPGTWCSGPLGKVRALPRERALTTASTVAWMFSLGDQASIRERAAVPILESLWRSATASVSNCASAATCWQGYTKPVSPSRTRSCAAPTRSLAITGHPHSMASLTTTANGSYSDGSTMTSAEVYTAGSCD